MALSSYLNDLPQINCNSAIPSRAIQIDCRWFKTLIYLEKRHLEVEITNSLVSDFQCDLKKITSSIPVLSKCLRSFSNNKGTHSNADNTDNSSTNSTEFIRIDMSNKFELTIEPKLNQLLFEGWYSFPGVYLHI